MPDYDSILIPVDESPPSDRGVERGLDIAADSDAEVHFLHVLDETRYDGGQTALSTYELALEEAEKSASETLESLADRARTRGVDAEAHCRRGKPHEEIVALADRVGADLVVMGRHGERTGETPHLGSVADQVLRAADQSVLTV